MAIEHCVDDSSCHVHIPTGDREIWALIVAQHRPYLVDRINLSNDLAKVSYHPVPQTFHR